MGEGQAGSFIDKRDGQEYRTVKMPDGKVWMAQNLNYMPPTGGGCWVYGNDPELRYILGLLYDWETANRIAPEGWHLPSAEEWEALIKAVGGEKNAGKHLKADIGWTKESFFGGTSYDGGGKNSYGFSA